MIEILWQADRGLFLLINHLPHNLLLDSFFAFLSGVGTWGAVWFIIGIILFIFEGIKDKSGLVALILAFLLSVLLVEIGLKNIVRRERPPLVLSQTILVGETSNSFSFPSGHATLAFAGALILARHHKKWKWFYFILAALIAFSRVYLGKHYPGDVIGGGMVGLVIGYLCLKIISRSNNLTFQ